jgi:transposase
MQWNSLAQARVLRKTPLNLAKSRAIATRYDKLKRTFEGSMALACAFLWLPM